MLDGDVIGKKESEVMASKLFEEFMTLDMLEGKGSYVTLTMPTNEACNHVRPLYVMAKFDGQLVSKVLVDNGATFNVLLASILRKLGKKKSDMLSIDLIMTNFYGTVMQPLGVISIELNISHHIDKRTFFLL